METTSMNTLIDDFNALPIEDMEYAVELIKKTYAEAQRDVILSNAQIAEQNLIKGNIKRGTFQELHNDLEND
jgi:ssDNA-specific exonuclease RecJ